MHLSYFQEFLQLLKIYYIHAFLRFFFLTRKLKFYTNINLKAQRSMASKPINIRWIRTGSILKNQTILHELLNKNHKINTSFVSPEGPKAKKTGFKLIIFNF